MPTPDANPHKKGEHVFNDIAGSVTNSFEGALKTPQLRSLVLNGPHGDIRIQALPQSLAMLAKLRQDRILSEARTVVAPALGVVNDPNSRIYGAARLKLEQAVSDAVAACASLAWRKKRRPDSSFHQFESVVSGLRDSKTLIAQVGVAMAALIDAGYDPIAERAALAERVSEVELSRRRNAITAMKAHLPALKQTTGALVATFFDELDRVLEQRITGA